MLNKMTILHKKLRKERSSEIAAACDITRNSMSIELYDTAMNRVYAKSSLFGTEITAETSKEMISKLLVTALRENNIPSSAVKSVGIAADVHISEYLERELTAGDLFLNPDIEIYFPPFISMRISGRFTASLTTIPEEIYTAADFGSSFYIAEKKSTGELVCAAFPLVGAFDGSRIESGMPAEEGAIDIVRREKDGTLSYEVVNDAFSTGISPCGAAMAAALMLDEGIIDSDGIMYDRDLFFIGEDFFISQEDIRSIQSDKARTAAVLDLFQCDNNTFFSGEPFSSPDGLKTLIRLGAIPEKLKKAAFARNSVLRGVENCLKSPDIRKKAENIAKNAKDITDEIISEYDERYLENLRF